MGKNFKNEQIKKYILNFKYAKSSRSNPRWHEEAEVKTVRNVAVADQNTKSSLYIVYLTNIKELSCFRIFSDFTTLLFKRFSKSLWKIVGSFELLGINL